MAAVDAYELLEAVEILSKMPKDFYDKIVSLYNNEDDLTTSLSVLTGQLLSWIALKGKLNLLKGNPGPQE